MNTRRNGINFVLADASYLPFKEATFDIVYSFGTIEHSKRTFHCIKESFRVLKHGGQVTHTVPNMFSLHSILARPLLVGLKRWKLGLEKSFTIAQFYRMLKRSGFVNIAYDYLHLNPKLVTVKTYSSPRIVFLFNNLDNFIANIVPLWGFFIAMSGFR